MRKAVSFAISLIRNSVSGLMGSDYEISLFLLFIALDDCGGGGAIDRTGGNARKVLRFRPDTLDRIFSPVH